MILIIKSVSRIATIAVLLAVLLASCTSMADPNEGLQVVATTSIVGDIAEHVVGNDGSVEVLMPIGVDAHDFQPSAQQVARLAEADLVVANGLGLEQGLIHAIEGVEADGTPVIELAPLVDPIPFIEPHGHEDEEHEEEPVSTEGAEHEHGTEDPHFWMDPLRVGAAANALAESLIDIDDGGWEERAGEYQAEMAATDDEIASLLDSIPAESREIVTNHEAFGYFADRYDFEILGVVIPGGSTLAEPSSAELAELVETMEHEGVRVIFAETTQPSRLAEAVAAELGEGVEVVELYTESLGGPDSGAETLAGMLLTNASRIAEALS